MKFLWNSYEILKINLWNSYEIDLGWKVQKPHLTVREAFFIFFFEPPISPNTSLTARLSFVIVHFSYMICGGISLWLIYLSRLNAATFNLSRELTRFYRKWWFWKNTSSLWIEPETFWSRCDWYCRIEPETFWSRCDWYYS